MILNIYFHNQQLKITLDKNGKVLDYLNWQDKRDLMEKILLKIDEILKRNHLKINDLKKVRTHINLDETYSSYRILKTVEKTLNFCLKN